MAVGWRVKGIWEEAAGQEIRGPYGQIGGDLEREYKERHILIKRYIMGSGRNLLLWKFPGIQKDDTPVKILINS